MDGSILILSYSQLEREKVKMILGRIGNFNVIEIPSPDSFHINDDEQFRDIQLVLLDIEFPSEGDGLETLRQLRSNSCIPDVPIIVIAKRDKTELKQAAAKYAVKDYIVKPYHLKRLENSIRSMVKVSRKFYYSVENIDTVNMTFEEFIKREFKYADRMKQPLSLLFITTRPSEGKEEDPFPISEEMRRKSYSILFEKAGHTIRATDKVFTNNGKDILVFLPGTDSGKAWAVFERIKGIAVRELETMNLKFDDLFYAACVTYPAEGDSFQSLMENVFRKLEDKEMLEKMTSIPLNARRYAGRRYNQFKKWF